MKFHTDYLSRDWQLIIGLQPHKEKCDAQNPLEKRGIGYKTGKETRFYEWESISSTPFLPGVSYYEHSRQHLLGAKTVNGVVRES